MMFFYKKCSLADSTVSFVVPEDVIIGHLYNVMLTNVGFVHKFNI